MENKKAIVRDFSAVLLESEYRLLISGIETLIMGNQDRINLETIEPLVILSINKENGNYSFKIKIILEDDSKFNSNLFEITCNKEKLKCFAEVLKSNLNELENY